jgi:oligopeptidase B
MRLTFFLSAIVLIMISCNDTKTASKETFKWPEVWLYRRPKVNPKELVAHGDVRIDNYYWMNDYFKKGLTVPKLVDYLKAENA